PVVTMGSRKYQAVPRGRGGGGHRGPGHAGGAAGQARTSALGGTGALAAGDRRNPCFGPLHERSPGAPPQDASRPRRLCHAHVGNAWLRGAGKMADTAAAGGRTFLRCGGRHALSGSLDRKSTRLNSSHVKISYAVFCLKKK